MSGKSGTFILTQSSQDEFYNGELSGSDTIATTAEALLGNPYKSSPTNINSYNIKVFRGDGSDNRGQTTEAVLSTSDTSTNNANWAQLPGAVFSLVRNLPYNILPTQYTTSDYLIDDKRYNNFSYYDNLNFDAQPYLILAKSEGSINYGARDNLLFSVSSSYTYSDIDSIMLPVTQNVFVYGGGASINDYNYFPIYSKMRPNFYIKVQAQQDPTRYIIYRFASSSAYNYGADMNRLDDNSSQYNTTVAIILTSGSIISSQGNLSHGELVSMYIDEPATPNNYGILLRDFTDKTWSTPEGSLYLFYDTGSNLI